MQFKRYVLLAFAALTIIIAIIIILWPDVTAAQPTIVHSKVQTGST